MSVVAALRDLAISVDGRSRTLTRAAAYAVLVMVVALAVNGTASALAIEPMKDVHAMASLELALSRSFCGAPSAYSEQYRMPQYLRANPSRIDTPMRALLAEQAGSLQAYCRTAVQPFVNNENSLMVTEWTLLSAMPDLSFRQLGRRLHQLRVAGVALVAFASLAAGMSVGFACALTGVSLLLLRLMHESAYSAYPFLFVLIAVAASVYVLADRRGATAGVGGRLLVASIAGVVSGFGSNMRTSYLPVYVAMFVIFTVVTGVRAVARRSWRAWALYAVPMVFAFVAAHAAFQYLCITRYLPAKAAYNASIHSIAHPLVLSLAQPPNDLSRREGIEWLDESGRQIALRVDPTATYLGPRYDAALYRYYFGLWRTHPREMARIYALKFRIAGTEIVRHLTQAPGLLGRAARILLPPLAMLPNGIWLAAVVALVTGWALVRAGRDGLPAGLLVGLLGVAALLLLTESAIIYPFYELNYHNYLVFYVFFLALCGVQFVADVLWRLVIGGRRQDVDLVSA